MMKRVRNFFGPWNWTRRYAIYAIFAATTTALPAQTFTTLYSFDKTDGDYPIAGLIQGADGNLYGSTSFGGTGKYGGNGDEDYNGTLFKITPAGTLTTLHNFCSQLHCADGSDIYASLVQATNLDFYGVAASGGVNDSGTLFKISPAGSFTLLYSFNASNEGSWIPYGGLVQANDGNLYGTTYYGGQNSEHAGTVFRITPMGTLTTLYNFCSQSGCTDGQGPSGQLIQATDGNLYGTTENGGNPFCQNGCGTVFKLTLSGALTTLYRFCSHPQCADGLDPFAGLVQASDGDLYGTTLYGGPYSAYGQFGTVFKITTSGALTSLHAFCSMKNCADGFNPSGKLIQASDGDLYGTTQFGGIGSVQGGGKNDGTIFKITPSGALTTVYNFCAEGRSCADGRTPFAGLVQATDGILYGTTQEGGIHGYGTVFRISVGPGPSGRQ